MLGVPRETPLRFGGRRAALRRFEARERLGRIEAVSRFVMCRARRRRRPARDHASRITSHAVIHASAASTTIVSACNQRRPPASGAFPPRGISLPPDTIGGSRHRSKSRAA